MKLGVWNSLIIDRFTPPGAYLLDEAGNDVLLPNKYVTDAYNEGDTLDVFLYKDSEDRIVATTRQPYIQLGEFAWLRVSEMNAHGAFMDWGLEKDLLVPFREQPKDMVEGRSYLVFMYLDDPTQRLAATARVNPFYESALDVLEKNEEVELLICEETELGQKVIINNRYKGLIFHGDIHQRLRTGERTIGFVKNVREDGKVDVLLHPEGYEKVEPLSQEFMEIMKKNDGFLALTDKSAPADVQKITGWSKKTFKQVIGKLYKQQLIILHENGITLK